MMSGMCVRTVSSFVVSANVGEFWDYGHRRIGWALSCCIGVDALCNGSHRLVERLLPRPQWGNEQEKSVWLESMALDMDRLCVSR